MVSGFKSGFGAFMNAAKSVVAKVEEKVDDLLGNTPAAAPKARIGIDHELVFSLRKLGNLW